MNELTQIAIVGYGLASVLAYRYLSKTDMIDSERDKVFLSLYWFIPLLVYLDQFFDE